MDNHIQPQKSMLEQKPTLSSYLPLIIIIGAIIGVTMLRQMMPCFTLKTAMSDFMAFFFTTFAMLKLINLRGFVDAYRSYDLLARKSFVYAYAYPFIELALGIAYFYRAFPFAVNLITLILMSINSIGVIYALTLEHSFTCACMGTLLNVPVTVVSLFENLTMAVMALIMLIWF
jgi:hypothetical protein